jgi:hypothetical protein
MLTVPFANAATRWLPPPRPYISSPWGCKTLDQARLTLWQGRDGAGGRERGPLPPVAPEAAASSHPVETPIEALRCRTEKKRGEDPAGSGTDEDGQGQRQVCERQRQGRPDERRPERHGRWG